MPAKKKSKKTSKKTSTTKKTSKKSSKKKSAKKAATPTVLLVNIIPRSLSGESNQDSEPTVAGKPANPLQIVATAFTPDPQRGQFAPIFLSQDGGNTWTLNSIVPGANRL